MIDITWDTPETSGHSRKASTIHGWVTKMRGTLVDDERIRKQGIREMEHARRIREWKKEKGIEEQNNLLFSFVPKKPPQPNNQVMIVRRHTTTSARQSSTRSPPSRSASQHRRHDSRPQLTQKAYSAPNGRLLRDATRSGTTSPPSGQLVRAGTQVRRDGTSGHRSEHSRHHHRSGSQSTRQASLPLPGGSHQRSQSRRQASSSGTRSPGGRPTKRHTH